MVSKFFFSLESIKPQISTAAGSLTSVTSKETPGFIEISFSNLRLKNRGSLEPHWHPNANKLGYCLKGDVIVSIRTPSQVETFTVKKGEMFFIPQGYIHHIENINEQESVISFVLNHSTPETLFLSKSIYSISDNVFNSTFNTEAKFASDLKKSKNEELIKTLKPLKKIPDPIESLYKFNIEGSEKTILTKGGYLQVGTKQTFSNLKGLGILGFGLNRKGSVEPHWHTNAGELIYIIKGQARITLLSPDNSIEVLEAHGGQGAFAPASYFHNIENIGQDEMEVIAFFGHDSPDYMGISEVIGSYSNELLASIFNTAPHYWDSLKKNEKPLVIVPS